MLRLSGNDLISVPLKTIPRASFRRRRQLRLIAELLARKRVKRLFSARFAGAVIRHQRTLCSTLASAMARSDLFTTIA